jgi:hypothetical protein
MYLGPQRAAKPKPGVRFWIEYPSWRPSPGDRFRDGDTSRHAGPLEAPDGRAEEVVVGRQPVVNRGRRYAGHNGRVF